MIDPTDGVRSRPVVPKPKTSTPAAVKPVAQKPAEAPQSGFEDPKKKPVSITGRFKRGADGMPANPELAQQVAANRTAAAAGSVATGGKTDAKVSAAVQRLSKSGATAADFKTEMSKLSPSQQLAVLKSLPYEVRAKLTAELEKLPADQRGTQLSWLGDRNLAGLSKDGYVAITPGRSYYLNDNRYPVTWAERIDLGNGRTITASHEDGYMMVKVGSKKLRAEWTPTGWQFFERTHSPRNGDRIDHEGRAWRPVTAPDKEEALLITAFREGSAVAAGFSGKLDPATEQLFRDQEITAQIPAARKAFDQLEARTKDLEQWVASSASAMADSQKWIAPAVKKGYLQLSTGEGGRVQLKLVRPGGMSDGEWRKIQSEFGPRIAQFEKRLQDDQSWLETNLSMRERAASELYTTFMSAPYQKYLEGLPPHQRLAEATRVSQALKGTAAGRQLAESLFGDRALRQDASGKLVPSTAFAKMVLEGAWSSRDGREALRELTLSLAPQLPGAGHESLGRMFEVMRGRALTAREWEAVIALHNVSSPKEFEKLVKPDAKAPQSALDKAGDVSDLLSELGSAAEPDKLRAAGGGVTEALKIRRAADAAADALESKAATFARGAHYVALFQVFNSTKDLITEGINVDTASAFAEDAARAIGTWGAVAEAAGKTGFITKVGRVAGPVSDAIGLINDMRRADKTSSSEGRYRANVHVGASALILAGGLAGGPVGVAGVLVGLGVKLFYDRTSEAYEEMHGTLKRVFPMD